MTAPRTVTFVGIGAIGLPMAQQIHQAGFDVTGVDPFEAQREKATAAGLTAEATSASAAQADTVVVMVATPDQLRDAALGDGGLVGRMREGATIVEASSGSTAVSEAYFARLLGLPFVAVMPRSTSAEKIALIEFYGGRCHFVDGAGEVYDAARAVAAQTGGHYMDQFTYAERATDWRGNNNIAESMFTQMQRERHPVPRWIVVGAGTGGTSATIGRYLRYQRHATQVCVADPAGSVFGAYHRTGDATLTAPGSRIEGIGRPRVEPSFIRTLVDRMEEVADDDSVAAMRVLSTLLGRRVGPSTGTNFVAMLRLAQEMRTQGQQGSILSLLCDAGERYLPTYHNEDWVRRCLGDCADAGERLQGRMA